MTLKTVPVRPCCDTCVTSGFVLADFDYREPFVIYSGLKTLPAKARRELVEALIANAEGDVILVVSAPNPECDEEVTEDDAANGVPVDPETPPSDEKLDRLLAAAADEAAH